MTSIRAIGGALPEQEVTNADLDRANPSWRMELVAELTGIQSRRFASENETAFDLSVRACDELLGQPGVDRIDAILYCTQNPDYPGPGNVYLLHEQLGLSDDVLAFDFHMACSGFVYGLAMADSFARSGTASGILLVTAETPSKHINPGDRSARVLFGDGAAATYISAGDERGGRIVASELCTHGRGFKYAYSPGGGARNPWSSETSLERTDQSGNVRTARDLHMNGTELWGFVSSAVPKHIEGFLARQSLALDDIDVWVFHQGSKMILDTLAKALGIPSEKVFVHMRDIGNLSHASIPFALRAALDEGAIQPGDRVLLSAFGAGISYGSAIVEF
jgi:3-oxoacyl-[acyl-carrier-protein] synthase III